jgi:CBS domain-containing protein
MSAIEDDKTEEPTGETTAPAEPTAATATAEVPAEAKAPPAEVKAPPARESEPEVTFEVEPENANPPPLPRKDAAPEPINVTASVAARAWPPKTVADLMARKVITVSETERVGDLETWMDRFRFGHLPIVNEAGKLVGLITHTDFLHAALGTGPDGSAIDKLGPDTRAVEIMRRGVVTARPDAELTMALKVMLQEKIGCLPVILEDETLVGIVTATDFNRLALEMLERQA